MAQDPKPQTVKHPIALEERSDVDGRLFSPSAGRNKSFIGDVLAEIMPNNASVLEIASGTGEHGVEAAARRADVSWQFSDPDETSRISQAAWIDSLGLGFPAPVNIDTAQPGWSLGLESYDLIFCSNMIHIAPWEAAVGIAKEAAACLSPEGMIGLYGPFLQGEDSVPSNLDFDASLKSRNPRWGVRELESVKHIFAKNGFNQLTRREMPKNNLFLLISR